MLPATAAAQATVSARVYDVAPPMNVTVRDRIAPQIDALLSQLLRDGRATRIDGVAVFGSGDKFLPGKIAAAMAYRIAELPDGDVRLNARLADFARIAQLTLDDPNESWGIYYYLAALEQLHARGLLSRALPPAALDALRRKLDWRSFVRPDLTLKNLPNNYYGVAFAVARLRYRLGWEDVSASEALLARTLDHYRRYSGEYGFADETEGAGRYDRYSVLLIGEIAQRLLETGREAPPEVLKWLRRSVDLLLPQFNLRGEGFAYGRSIGAYGETAFLEVLTAAARLGVLTPVEAEMAYAFSTRVTARYADFWLDSATGSVNLWDGGRRTDGYRGKHRIFGENLSLARQYMYTSAIWNQLGYRDAAPDAGFAQWLRALPRVTTIRFAEKPYDRLLVIVRDGDRVISLPLISGAAGYHAQNAYFPAPFAANISQGAADSAYPHLVPRITLASGAVVAPLVYFEGVKVSRQGTTTKVSWRQPVLDQIGETDPRPSKAASIETQIVFSPGKIARRDRIRSARGVALKGIGLEFASFSQGAVAQSDRYRFARGIVTGFATTGLGTCTSVPPEAPTYRAPTGAFNSLIRCSRADATSREISTGWTLFYTPTDR